MVDADKVVEIVFEGEVIAELGGHVERPFHSFI